MIAELVFWGGELKGLRLEALRHRRRLRAAARRRSSRPANVGSALGRERRTVPSLTGTTSRLPVTGAQPLPEHAADAAELRLLHDTGEVAGAVVPRVWRAADTRRGEPRRLERPVVAGPVGAARPVRHPDGPRRSPQRPRRRGRHDVPVADRHARPDTDAIERDHGAQSLGVPRRTDARPSRATRSGARFPSRSAAPRRRRPRRRPASRVGSAAASRAVSRTTATPEALSSAPGACGTVSRWAPTTRRARPGRRPGGRATTFHVSPAPTGTPHELPAGTCSRCRCTS